MMGMLRPPIPGIPDESVHPLETRFFVIKRSDVQ